MPEAKRKKCCKSGLEIGHEYQSNQSKTYIADDKDTLKVHFNSCNKR